jgi:hypothetical protein
VEKNAFATATSSLSPLQVTSSLDSNLTSVSSEMSYRSRHFCSSSIDLPQDTLTGIAPSRDSTGRVSALAKHNPIYRMEATEDSSTQPYDLSGALDRSGAGIASPPAARAGRAGLRCRGCRIKAAQP